MTNSEQAIREFAEIWGFSQYIDALGYEQVKNLTEKCLSDLTALIEEHYVSKEDHEKTLQQRDELLKTMKSIYCTTDANDQNSMQHAIYRIGAAIKNTER